MDNLQERFGLYRIEKGTLLFRNSDNTLVKEQMFFGFSTTGTFSSDSKNNSIQVWKTEKNIDTLLMLKGVNAAKRGISAICDIWNIYFPHSKVQEEDNIPQYVFLKKDPQHRNELVRKLREDGISGWVCSVENKHEMEFFLFNDLDNNRSCVKYINTIDSANNDLYKEDSFRREVLYSLKPWRDDSQSDFDILLGS